MATKNELSPDVAIHPGEILAEELEARSLTQVELASQMGRPVQAINEIIKGKKAITAATALELEQALGVPAHVWVNLQGQYELTQARLAAEGTRRTTTAAGGGSFGAASFFPSRRLAGFAFTKKKAKKK
jgi:HTH-type transcriptional regulator/antitoxin HigA